MSVSRMLSKAVGAAFLAGAALVAVPAVASATPMTPTAATVAEAATVCIPQGTVIGNGPLNSVDKQANVYVGGDFNLKVGAELEGLLVVEGDAVFDNAALYNMGVVGVGSRMTPPAMSDMVIVGGNMTVLGGEIQVGHSIGGNVRVGGAFTAPQRSVTTDGGSIADNLGKADALNDWAGLGTQLQQQSAKYAALQATGTHSADYGTLTLVGDGTKNRQVFTLSGAELDQAKTLKYENIDPEAIVVINVTGETAEFQMQSVLEPDSDTTMISPEAFVQLSQRLLWNIPDASNVTIGDDAQFPGSVLVANPDSSTIMRAPGTNGRFWVAGDLTQNRLGSEFHAFPFLDDDVFSCTPEPPTTDPVDPETLIELVTPKVTQAICLDDGKIAAPVIEFLETAGVTFDIEGEPRAGETVTVVATVTGHRLLSATKGWQLSADAKRATIQIVLDNVECSAPGEPGEPAEPAEPNDPQVTEPNDPKVDEPQPTGPESTGVVEPAQPLAKAAGLAATGGAPVTGLLAAAGALLSAGLVTVLVTRRRAGAAATE